MRSLQKDIPLDDYAVNQDVLGMTSNISHFMMSRLHVLCIITTYDIRISRNQASIRPNFDPYPDGPVDYPEINNRVIIRDYSNLMSLCLIILLLQKDSGKPVLLSFL